MPHLLRPNCQRTIEPAILPKECNRPASAKEAEGGFSLRASVNRDASLNPFSGYFARQFHCEKRPTFARLPQTGSGPIYRLNQRASKGAGKKLLTEGRLTLSFAAPAGSLPDSPASQPAIDPRTRHPTRIGQRIKPPQRKIFTNLEPSPHLVFTVRFACYPPWATRRAESRFTTESRSRGEKAAEWFWSSVFLTNYSRSRCSFRASAPPW